MRGASAVSAFVAGWLLASSALAADKVRASIFRIGASANAFIAKKEGFFAKNNLDVEFIEFRNGNEAITANRGGSVDILMSIPGTVMMAMERGFDLVLLTQNEVARAQGPDAGSIQVLADSPYQKLADLAGKKLAVSGLHSQMSVSVQTALEKAGVDWSKMQVMELPFPTMNDALRAKQVDAVAQLDPFTTQLRTSGGGRVLSWLYVDAVPEQPIGAWYATKTYVDKNRDLVNRYVKSLQEAIDWLGSYSRLQFVEDSLGNATDPGQVAAKARYAAGAAAALEGACPAGNGSAATGTAAPGRRRNLVVSIVGDTWDEGTWLDRPEAATFSVVAIYYGSNRSYSCAPCAATVHWRGPKWRLIGQLMANATHAGLLESITPPGGFDYV